MRDTIIKGAGNSRLLKSVPNALTLYPTYESFVQALATVGLPIDLLGLQAAGVEQMGTDLNKANLLSDATETAIWGNATDRTINDTLLKLSESFLISGFNGRVAELITESGSWVAQSGVAKNKYTIVCVGGGGGGGGASGVIGSVSNYKGAGGGGGGFFGIAGRGGTGGGGGSHSGSTGSVGQNGCVLILYLKEI